MELDERHLTTVGFVLTWLAGIFSLGAVYGRISAKVDKHEAAIFNDAGEMRIITYAAHDLMSTNCNEKRDIRIMHVIESNEELKEDIAKLSDTVQREMKLLSEALHSMAITQASDRSQAADRHREADRRREAER